MRIIIINDMVKRHFSSLLAALLIGGLAISSTAPQAYAAEAAESIQVAKAATQATAATPAQARTTAAVRASQTNPVQAQSVLPASPANVDGGTDWESRLVLDHGHVDAFSVFPEGDGVTLAVTEDVTQTHKRRPANEVLLHVKESAYTEVTARISGIERAGYALPQTQNPELLWPGWDSMAIADKMPEASVYLSVDEIRGPGEVFVWQDTFSGDPQPVLDSGLRMQNGATIKQSAPAHSHANWLFTKPGAYQMTLHASVTDQGKSLASNAATFTWIVGDLKAGISSLNDSSESGSNDSISEGETQPKDDEHENEGQGGPKSDPQEDTTPPSSGGTSEAGQDDSAPAPKDNGSAQTPKPAPTPAPNANVGGSDAPNTPQSVEQCIPTEVTVPAAGSASGSHTIAANTHVHPNWVFSKPGTYRVSLTQSATSKTGKQLRATGTLTFNVGGTGNATSGHFDVGAAVESGQLVMLVKDDRSAPAVWRKPSELVFSLSDSAKIKAPAGIEFVAPAGAPVWIISATQMPGVPWVGANTQHPTLASATTGSVTWTVNSVQGPGAMAVFESGAFGQVVGQRWFGASGNGTAKVFVGKTASGKDCELSAEQIAEIEAAGGTVGGRLAKTGADQPLLWLGAALSMMLAGALLLRVARPTSPVRS